MTDRTEYNKRYQRENREELLAKRRQRYREDAGYREDCKRRAREYRERYPERTKRTVGAKKTVRPRVRLVPHITVNGEDIPLMLSIEVAKRIGVDNSTIGHWHKTGKVPLPVMDGKIRWYSPHQVELLRRLGAIGNDGGASQERKEILEEINASWWG